MRIRLGSAKAWQMFAWSRLTWRASRSSMMSLPPGLGRPQGVVDPAIHSCACHYMIASIGVLVSSPTSDAPRAKRAARAPTQFRDGCASFARPRDPAGAGPPGSLGRASQNALALCYFTTSLFETDGGESERGGSPHRGAAPVDSVPRTAKARYQRKAGFSRP